MLFSFFCFYLSLFVICKTTALLSIKLIFLAEISKKMLIQNDSK